MKRLLKSSIVVSGSIFISRLTGFCRDILFAIFFGGSAELDAFLIAFKIPNFFRRMLAEGAFSQGFIPILTEQKTICKDKIKELKIFISSILFQLSIVSLLVVILGTVFSSYVINAFAPGFVNDIYKFNLASNLLQITMPYLLLIAITNLYAGVLNSYNHFFVPSISSVFLNIALILGAYVSQYDFWLAMEFHPIVGLAVAVVVGGVVQWALNLMMLVKMKLACWPKPIWHKATSKLLRLMYPAMIVFSATQINLMIDSILASFLVSGSISWLYYSDRLMEFPLGVFGVASAIVLMPKLSNAFVNKQHAEIKESINFTLKILLVLILPCSIALIVLASPLLTTLFQYGSYTVNDMLQTSLSLQTYTIGLGGFVLIKVLAAVFYSQQKANILVKISLFAVMINLIFSLLLIQPLQHQGLALATSIAAWTNALILLFLVSKQGWLIFDKKWLIFILQLLCASGVFIIVLFLLNPTVQTWVDFDVWQRIAYLVGIMVCSGFAYLVGLWVVGVRQQSFT